MQIMKNYITYLPIITIILISSLCFGQQTYRDNFSSSSYSNNNGNTNFSTNWIESGDDNSAANGYIRITGNELRFAYIWTETIIRSANLTGASTATLSFDWRTVSLESGETLDVQASTNGTTFTTLATFSGTQTGVFSQNINGYISNNTTIRFIKGGANWSGNDDQVFIDNFLISATVGAAVTVDDVTVNEGAGTATFTVTHTGANATGAFTVNYTTANGTATAGNDYTAKTGVLSFTGTAGVTRSFTVNILEDTAFENAETFFIQFTSTSNINVNISDTAIGTIIDNDAIIMTNGATANTCNDIFLDSGGVSNYANNLNEVYTICPDTANNYINVNFTNFDIASGDLLSIYEGTTTGGTLIGQYNNGNVATIIESTHSSGCLTFRFTSNNNTTAGGWQANVTCYPEGPKIVVDDISFDETVGNAVFTVRQTRAAHGYTVPIFGFINTSFTVNYTTVNGTALSGSDYTATSGTLTFNGQIGNVQTISVPISNDGVPELAEDFRIIFTGANAQYATINYSDTGTGTINSQILANDPLTLVKEFDGYFDYTTTGGSLRTNDNFTDACSITNSSSNTLIAPIPTTATIEKAYLYWAHSSTVTDPNVTFEGQAVSANFIYQTTLTNRNFYGYVSDVTSIVQGVANPSTNTWDFTGLTVDNTGNYCSTATVLGGWSLMVFYEDPNLSAVNINLYQGFDGLSNNGTSFTLDSFYAITGTGAKATFLSWEGDSNLDSSSAGSTNPELLSITSQGGGPPNPLIGDGGQTGNNAYNSTIFDNTVSPVYSNTTSYGIDLDTYDISSYISPADSQVTANVDAGQDFIISAAVVLKVPSNLIAGTVFEDKNYPGGPGRNIASSGGLGVSGAIVELFNSTGTFIQRKNTDINGDYSFGGMADGNYRIKVVNSTVKSNRGGGLNCSTCHAIQTFRKYRSGTTLIDVNNEVGGVNPSASQDVALGVINGAQSSSIVSVSGNGVVGINFGFNFNTIVNTNESGQGSLEQFIINSNNLTEVGLDIEANSIFNPTAGSDTSIFMIPPSSDALGRTADANFTNGYFDILISNSKQLSIITGINTQIDGRTQTAYSGNTNGGTIGSGGVAVGVSANSLPIFDRPEIQVHRNNGGVIRLQGTNDLVRNIAVYAGNNSGLQILGGSSTVSNSLLGVNALGANAGNINIGVEITGGTSTIEGNFISTNQDNGVLVNGGTTSIIRYNHFINNGNAACDDAILLTAGSGIQIERNLIETSASTAIDGELISGGVIITENSLTSSGQNGGNCTGNQQQMAIRLAGNGSSITNNRIYQNGGSGVAIIGGTSNLISRNSIYANGTASAALGIDLNNNGVTINDLNDTDSGPNNLLNFPIISAVYSSGSNLVVEGWSRPGTTIELFLTDINQGSAVLGSNQLGLSTDYGEGQTFIGTMVEGSAADLFAGTAPYTDLDGNTDNTNKFKFVIPKPVGVLTGNFITSTATLSNSTSEFSPFSIIKNYTVITNRRITYRVKKN